MRSFPLLRPLLALAAASALIGPAAALSAPAAAQATSSAAAGDATVIAVIDSGFSPYHQDFLASKMPAAARPPLQAPPHTWLPGFPKPSSFASYSPLTLTLDASDDADMQELHDEDREEWQSVQASGSNGINFRWIPGTKVVGALTFGPEASDRPSDQARGAVARNPGTIYGDGGTEHGMGSASSAVGNLFGTCPQCLLVHIEYTTRSSAERALAWVHSQPWIDAVTNSYSFSATLVARDDLYHGPGVEVGKRASERGQTTFFAAGNGLENVAYVVPSTTLLSSQMGPDWVVTVGGVDPRNDRNQPGVGKPVDVAGIGDGYPTSYGSTTTSNGGKFSGTSNATPQLAGTYGRALWEARRVLPGASRAQAGGVVAAGRPVTCGAKRRACELADGRLTAVELRTRLLQGATPSPGGFSGGESVAPTPDVADTRWASEGHGSYRGKLDKAWDRTFRARLLGPMLGTAAAPVRPDGEVEWFRVDSACRQHLWGTWRDGAYKDEQTTPQPAPDPVAWPTRTGIQEACPYLMPPPRQIH